MRLREHQEAPTQGKTYTLVNQGHKPSLAPPLPRSPHSTSQSACSPPLSELEFIHLCISAQQPHIKLAKTLRPLTKAVHARLSFKSVNLYFREGNRNINCFSKHSLENSS